MKLSIYQINLDRDENGVAFENYDNAVKVNGSKNVDAAIYDLVYSGEVEVDDLEDVYRIFNYDKPTNFNGRSFSVSDVVEVIESEDCASGFYYCDNIGFKKISFEKGKAIPKCEKITVLMVEPKKYAEVAEMAISLESLQEAVGGCIETYYPFSDDEVCIVCNDCGKLNGMDPCRAIYDEDGTVMDIVFGSFFICDASGGNFGSLNDEQIRKYMDLFYCPEYFTAVNGKIYAQTYRPECVNE